MSLTCGRSSATMCGRRIELSFKLRQRNADKCYGEVCHSRRRSRHAGCGDEVGILRTIDQAPPTSVTRRRP